MLTAAALLSGGLTGTYAQAADRPLDGLRLTAASADLVHSYVRSHPQAFGGSYEDARTRTVHVLTLDGSTSDRAQRSLIDFAQAGTAKSRTEEATAGTGTWTVVADPARYSLAALGSVRDQVGSGSAFAAKAGASLTSWYADPLTDTVRVGLTQVTPGLRKAAADEFGDRVTLFQEARHQSMVKVTHLDHAPKIRTPAPLPKGTSAALSPDSAAVTYTRLEDSVPFAGGTRLVYYVPFSGGGYTIYQCTANYKLTMTDGTAAMGTAGHCAPNGQSWYQGYYDEANQTISLQGVMGKVYKRIFGANVTDAEALDSTGNPYGFYPAIYTSNTGLSSVGTVTPVSVGDGSCSDGSFTGENCAGTISAVNACVNVADDGTTVHICNLNIATAGSRLVQSGDSGGPVYAKVSGVVHPQGLICAGTADGHTLDFSDMGFSDIGLSGYPTPT